MRRLMDQQDVYVVREPRHLHAHTHFKGELAKVTAYLLDLYPLRWNSRNC
ncbi:unnamed protein product [Blumeria hordei]|uniref:Uncharacterized protein n=1 Tax=Blumeria hordei TaxID=2867405 RepID=A0A383UT96_BLUHO|nr:unnamed protein product [Blumeria hordei]